MRAITCEAFCSYREHVPQRIFAMRNLICNVSLRCCLNFSVCALIR